MLNDETSRVFPCVPATEARPRGDEAAATIIILVVVLNSGYLATLGMTTAAIGSLLATTAAVAGFLVREMRGKPAR